MPKEPTGDEMPKDIQEKERIDPEAQRIVKETRKEMLSGALENIENFIEEKQREGKMLIGKKDYLDKLIAEKEELDKLLEEIEEKNTRLFTRTIDVLERLETEKDPLQIYNNLIVLNAFLSFDIAGIRDIYKEEEEEEEEEIEEGPARRCPKGHFIKNPKAKFCLHCGVGLSEKQEEK